jgi:hypothetical protein
LMSLNVNFDEVERFCDVLEEKGFQRVTYPTVSLKDLHGFAL